MTASDQTLPGTSIGRVSFLEAEISGAEVETLEKRLSVVAEDVMPGGKIPSIHPKSSGADTNEKWRAWGAKVRAGDEMAALPEATKKNAKLHSSRSEAAARAGIDVLTKKIKYLRARGAGRDSPASISELKALQSADRATDISEALCFEIKRTRNYAEHLEKELKMLTELIEMHQEPEDN
eukprot:gnl/MRDRNA2_/MRDRNA2_33942_c0_seq2.p1 gnl/MRDRNA2_/MRDRNA2_33942_c0~~gnl/MRDRNA2_/MRDRNA2_33942_c0_seq2.p1  ORF type:complete len:180 (+),score=46.33 gnl/MRDRNA2_/MRDRNA2_33942_c0_seq2:75-614(+)